MSCGCFGHLRGRCCSFLDNLRNLGVREWSSIVPVTEFGQNFRCWLHGVLKPGLPALWLRLHAQTWAALSTSHPSRRTQDYMAHQCQEPETERHVSYRCRYATPEGSKYRNPTFSYIFGTLNPLGLTVALAAIGEKCIGLADIDSSATELDGKPASPVESLGRRIEAWSHPGSNCTKR